MLHLRLVWIKSFVLQHNRINTIIKETDQKVDQHQEDQQKLTVLKRAQYLFLDLTQVTFSATVAMLRRWSESCTCSTKKSFYILEMCFF